MRRSTVSRMALSRPCSQIKQTVLALPARYRIARAALLGVATISILAIPAAAQINLYDSEDVAIDVGLDAATAAFAQSNPWFGEPEANIGVDTNSWAEFAIEPQLYLTLKNVLGGEVSAGISGVATKTYGESADGFAAGIDDPGKATLEKLYVGWKTDLGGDDFFEIVGEIGKMFGEF